MGTIEERVVQRAEKKLYLDQMVNRDGIKENGGGDDDTDGKGLGENDLLEMLSFGADEICNAGKGNQLSDLDIDHLIARSDYNPSTVRKSARSFNPIEAPMETRNFQGQYYEKYAQGSQEQLNGTRVATAVDVIQEQEEINGSHRAKRQRVSRLISITDAHGMTHQVLKSNTYSMEEGESSVFKNECKGSSHGAAPKRSYQVAGRDYENEDFCLICGEGGELILCDSCPAAYHVSCLGYDPNKSTKKTVGGAWRCPHHSCGICFRGTAAAGGLIFRCAECPSSFCEDHMPEDAEIIGRCLRMEKGGYKLPVQACYIHCSGECKANAEGCRGEEIMPSDFVACSPTHLVEETECNDDGSGSDDSQSITRLEEYDNSSVDSRSDSENENDDNLPNPLEYCGSDEDEEVVKPASKVAHSFTAMLESIDAGSLDKADDIHFAKFQLAFLKYQIPIEFSVLRCSGCLQFHQKSSCPLLSVNITGTPALADPLVMQMFDSSVPLSTRRRMFLCILRQFDCSKEIYVNPNEYGFSSQLKCKELCRFRNMCRFHNFGEVLLSFVEDGTILLRQKFNSFTFYASPKGVILMNQVFSEIIAEVEDVILSVVKNPGPHCELRVSVDTSSMWVGYHDGIPFSFLCEDIYGSKTKAALSMYLNSTYGQYYHVAENNFFETIISGLVESGKLMSKPAVCRQRKNTVVLSAPVPRAKYNAVISRDKEIAKVLRDQCLSLLPSDFQWAPLHNSAGRLRKKSIENPVYQTLLQYFPQSEVVSMMKSGVILPPLINDSYPGVLLARNWEKHFCLYLVKNGDIDKKVKWFVRR